MQTSTDLFLGTFLIFCGFVISLINLRRITKHSNSIKSTFHTVLLSENVIIMCIGIAFVSRSVYEFNPKNIVMNDVDKKSEELNNLKEKSALNCNFMSVLMSYGPLIVSLVNSFVSLVIDNFMHYTVLVDLNKKEEENYVQEIGQTSRNAVKKIRNNFFSIVRKYFPIIAAAVQWLVPLILTLSMYPIQVKEKEINANELRSLENLCMTMLDAANESCISLNNTLELRNYIPSVHYLITQEDTQNLSIHKAAEINSIIEKIYGIVNDIKEKTIEDHSSVNVSSQLLFRRQKSTKQICLTMCYLETKSLLLYMFLISIVSFFVPVTISTVILTKIHGMNVNKSKAKAYVTRELLYNIVFWTPVMFDIVLSLILCSYTMNGTRTSIFHVIANVYQVVKNFMNTKHFKDNTITPV